MATIIEGARWTLTEQAALIMEEKGLIKKCDSDHIDVLEMDKPIYHKNIKAPDWFGFSTIPGSITRTEREIENDSATK